MKRNFWNRLKFMLGNFYPVVSGFQGPQLTCSGCGAVGMDGTPFKHNEWCRANLIIDAQHRLIAPMLM